MNLRKKLGKQRHLEKATEAERLQKQAPPLHIRQVQSGDIGGTARGHTEARLLGGRILNSLGVASYIVIHWVTENCLFPILKRESDVTEQMFVCFLRIVPHVKHSKLLKK